MSTELVPELAVLPDLLLILEDVKTETSAVAGLDSANAISTEFKSADVILAGIKSADVNSAGVKSVDDILDRVETADSVQAGVESADLTYIVPEYAPEPEPPRQLQPYSQRTRSRPDLY